MGCVVMQKLKKNFLLSNYIRTRKLVFCFHDKMIVFFLKVCLITKSLVDVDNLPLAPIVIILVCLCLSVCLCASPQSASQNAFRISPGAQQVRVFYHLFGVI